MFSPRNETSPGYSDVCAVVAADIRRLAISRVRKLGAILDGEDDEDGDGV